jgi:hypothetical protein
MPNLVGPTDEGPIDPYTDPGGGAGIGLPPGYPVFPDNPPQNYPTGPSSTQSYYNAPHRTAPPPPPDPWAGVSSAVHSKASQDVDSFESLIGGAAPGFDSAGTALALAKSGVNVTGGDLDAFQWLYDNKLTAAQQTASPWAQYGMTKDTYTSTVQKMDSSYFSWTGDQLSGQGVGKNSLIWQAIRANATPDQIQNLAMYGNLTGTGPLLASAQFSGDMPWLSQGQTYSQTLQSFQSFEEKTPTDKATLAAFWRFGTSAKQVSGASEAVGTTTARPLLAGTEVR